MEKEVDIDGKDHKFNYHEDKLLLKKVDQCIQKANNWMLRILGSEKQLELYQKKATELFYSKEQLEKLRCNMESTVFGLSVAKFQVSIF